MLYQIYPTHFPKIEFYLTPFTFKVDKIFILNANGEFEVFHPNEEGQLSCVCSDEGNFHESKILSIDFLPSKNLVLTAAEDNKVIQ